MDKSYYDGGHRVVRDGVPCKVFIKPRGAAPSVEEMNDDELQDYLWTERPWFMDEISEQYILETRS